MQTEQQKKHQSWMSLSGRILEGGYELKDLIEADDTRALFRVRVLGDRDLVATALFLRLNPASSQHQIGIWEAVRALRNPNLNAPLGCGATDLDGFRTTYVVLRQPDESLAGALRERPLTPAEMKDALLNVAKGLEVLHLNGMVHGSVGPQQVHALGETIRLSGEVVRLAGVAPEFQLSPAQYLAPESLGANLTVEADLWCVGATVFESLTQKPWSEAEEGNLDALPEPFATIALRCLVGDASGRCPLSEIAALARGEIKPAPRPKPVPPPAAAPEPVQSPAEAAKAAASAAPAGDVRPAAAEPNRQNGKAPGEKESPGKAHGGPVRDSSSPGRDQPISTNGTFVGEPPLVEKNVPREKVEARGPIRQPMPVVGKRPVPKVHTIPDPVVKPDLRPRREQLASQRNELEPEDRSSKMWIWAGLALLGVLLLVWALRPRTPGVGKAVAVATASTAAGNSPNRVPPNSWETKTIQPDGTATSSSPSERAKPESTSNAHPVTTKPAGAVKAEPTPTSGRVWRTVLYTYQRESDARDKVKSLSAKHSNLHPEVFSPYGNGGPYLITAGGPTSREEAVQMRKKVISLGLPRDAYIQNYTR